jgi:Rieske Fe-S protein
MGDGQGLQKMARCEVCGNEYERAFQIRISGGDSHTFDSFECAIHALAPTCEHCGCRVIGHGVEADERSFCCAHGAREAGYSGIADRV